MFSFSLQISPNIRSRFTICWKMALFLFGIARATVYHTTEALILNIIVAIHGNVIFLSSNDLDLATNLLQIR